MRKIQFFPERMNAGGSIPSKQDVQNLSHLITSANSSAGRVSTRFPKQLIILKSVVEEFSRHYSKPEQRKEIAKYLYWCIPDTPVGLLGRWLLDCKPGSVTYQLFGERPKRTLMKTGLLCKNCGVEGGIDRKGNQEFEFESADLCLSCFKKNFWLRKKEIGLNQNQNLVPAEIKRTKQRLLELRTMAYQEYLQTPEWGETRKRSLELADHKCQICYDDSALLHTHHRTYRRLGQEAASDLTVLCQPCHELFHKHGKLK